VQRKWKIFGNIVEITKTFLGSNLKKIEIIREETKISKKFRRMQKWIKFNFGKIKED